MSKTETPSRLYNLVSKYWIWLVAFFGIVGIIALMWYLSKGTKKTTKAC
jgi:uncharacterized protein involved in exopolysaccharide biosynthesis